MPRMASRCASNPAAKCCRTTFSAVATASSSNWNPTTMREALQARLAERGVSSAEFSDLMIRLLDRGVLCRDESKREDRKSTRLNSSHVRISYAVFCLKKKKKKKD